MRSSGHLLKRAGREFLRNLIWMAVVLGLPAGILADVTDLYLVGVMAFLGTSVTVLAAMVTAGRSGAAPPTSRPSVATTPLASIPSLTVTTPTLAIGTVAVGMVVEETVAPREPKAAFTRPPGMLDASGVDASFSD